MNDNIKQAIEDKINDKEREIKYLKAQIKTKKQDLKMLNRTLELMEERNND